MTCKIILETLKFNVKDFRHIWRALGAMWSVESQFGSDQSRMHRLALALALA